MAWLAAVAKGGTSAIQSYQERQLKIDEIKGYREAKNRSMAATTRELAEEQRNKKFMHSRALALAAFSGAGVDDPGMVKILGDLNAEGEYRVMSKLWSGINEAQGLIYRAEQAEREEKSMRIAGAITALTAAGEGYSSASGGGFGGGG